MRRVVLLSVMPVLGLGLIGLSVGLNWEQVVLRVAGEKTAGQVAGMAVVRNQTSDVITAIRTELALRPASGAVVRVVYENYRLAGAWRIDEEGRERALATNEIPGAMAAVMNEAARGNADVVRWLLMRERRRASDEGRIERIEKTEIAQGYFGMTQAVGGLEWGEGEVRLAGGAGAGDAAERNVRGAVVTHAVFDMRDTALVQSNKGDALMSYVQVRGDETNSPAKRDFVLYCEPYETEFRPVFTYEAGGRHYARLSHIGRRGGPTLALVLYGPCWVYYDRRGPERAVLIANPGKMDGAVLAWFSRLCEGAFAQWGSGALIVLVGVLMLIVGLLQISLAVWPSRRLVEK